VLFGVMEDEVYFGIKGGEYISLPNTQYRLCLDLITEVDDCREQTAQCIVTVVSLSEHDPNSKQLLQKLTKAGIGT
jgi:hypothetical protein